MAKATAALRSPAEAPDLVGGPLVVGAGHVAEAALPPEPFPPYRPRARTDWLAQPTEPGLPTAPTACRTGARSRFAQGAARLAQAAKHQFKITPVPVSDTWVRAAAAIGDFDAQAKVQSPELRSAPTRKPDPITMKRAPIPTESHHRRLLSVGSVQRVGCAGS